jgi:hypothetical protein
MIFFSSGIVSGEFDAKLKVWMLAGLDVRPRYRIARSNICTFSAFCYL